jgi:hypothetical protein
MLDPSNVINDLTVIAHVLEKENESVPSNIAG